MTFFGLISADWWLIVLAYIGTFGPLGLALWLLAPDALERVWVIMRRPLGWLSARNAAIADGRGKRERWSS